MSITAREISTGDGWRLDDVLCRAGPHDRPFEERHGSPCVALVVAGSFLYRNGHGRALLAPGACLLGNEGQLFECSHEHQAGDRCLSFHYSPAFLESVLSGIDGARHLAFDSNRLAPTAHTLRQCAGLEAAAAMGDVALLAECAVDIAGAAYCTVIDAADPGAAPSSRDMRRIVAALRRIDGDDREDPDLATLAAEAAMSPFHFLRVFTRVVGSTPRQYQLRRRLARVAVGLRTTLLPISRLAADEGFNDLSSFDRMFRRSFRVAPRAWRTAGGASRPAGR